jgi:hypothetical protein
MTTIWNYVSSFFVICTSSWFNTTQCLKVWEYMPAYINDYVEFRRYGPYYREKEALKNDKNL